MSDADSTTEIGLQLRTNWPDDLFTEPRVVNQYAISIPLPLVDGTPEATGVYLTLGHATPPLVHGPEHLRELAAEGVVERPVQIYGSYFLSAARARELADTIIRHLDSRQP